LFRLGSHSLPFWPSSPGLSMLFFTWNKIITTIIWSAGWLFPHSPFSSQPQLYFCQRSWSARNDKIHFTGLFYKYFKLIIQFLFLSAFSVASTPTSQQTSQFNNSQLSFCDRTIDFDDNATMLSGRTYFSTNSANGLFRDKMERNNAWLMENSRNRFNANYKANSYATNDTMSLRSGFVI